jgi:hypothetical protein
MAKVWMLDELAHAGPEHLDPAFVAGYERKQGYPDPAEDLAVLAAHGLDERSTVVDLAAGTGRFSLAAARRFGQVIASYQHAGPPADAVYTRNALHQLPDFWKAVALDRVGGMLRPGGVLRLHDLVYDFQPSEADAALERWLDGAADDPVRGYTRLDLAEHIRTEHSTFRWLLEPMLAAAGFELLTAEFRGAVYGAYTCHRR